MVLLDHIPGVAVDGVHLLITPKLYIESIPVLSGLWKYSDDIEFFNRRG